MITRLFLLGSTTLIFVFLIIACSKKELKWDLSKKTEEIVLHLDFETTSMLTTQFTWSSNGTPNYANWEITPNGFSGNGLMANNNQVYGYGVSEGFIEFNYDLKKEGKVRFRYESLIGLQPKLETSFNGYIYLYEHEATLFVDDVDFGNFYYIPSKSEYQNQNSLSIANNKWFFLNSNTIPQGLHKIRIQFHSAPKNVDDLEVIEYSVE